MTADGGRDLGKALYAWAEGVRVSGGHPDRDARQRVGMGDGVVSGEVPRRGVCARIGTICLAVAGPDRRADGSDGGNEVGVLLGEQDGAVAAHGADPVRRTAEAETLATGDELVDHHCHGIPASS